MPFIVYLSCMRTHMFHGGGGGILADLPTADTCARILCFCCMYPGIFFLVKFEKAPRSIYTPRNEQTVVEYFIV